MTLSTHAAVGIMLAEWTGDPILGGIAALISHYVLDAIPHGDEFVYWRYIHNKDDRIAKSVATIDVLILSLMLTLLLTYGNEFSNTLVLVGALGGILPDLLINAETVLRRKKHITSPFLLMVQKCIKAHYRMHMFFHQLFFVPVRFRVALTLQLIGITAYLTFAL